MDSASTAWDFSQDLGNLGVNLGFGDFAVQSCDFLIVVNEINKFAFSQCLNYGAAVMFCVHILVLIGLQ